ncbi:MAG: DUF748 domain-containing protein [Pseudomonadota bacterium]
MTTKRIFTWKHFIIRNIEIIGIILVILILARIALPYIVKSYVNNTLDKMPEYDGRIGDVDIKLWRGAYEIENIKIVKTKGDVPEPFFKTKVAQLSIEWKAIFKGALVGEIELDTPVINFVKGPTAEQTQVDVDGPWLDIVSELFPLSINRLAIQNGIIYYRDYHSQPNVNLKLDKIMLLGENFTNQQSDAQQKLAAIDVKGRMFGEAAFKMAMKIDAFTNYPTFDMNFKTDPFTLRKVNDFPRAYANFDFEKGTLAIVAEMAAKDGELEGYIKPLFDKVAIVDLQQDGKNPIALVWEGLVAGVAQIFQNQPEERLATRIPLEGSFKEPDVKVLPTLGNILRNAFLEAYKGDIENVVELEGSEEK